VERAGIGAYLRVSEGTRNETRLVAHADESGDANQILTITGTTPIVRSGHSM
jgi:hypothetical protein